MEVYFGTQHSRVYIWANLIGENCANGMSWVLKKAALDAEGGVTAFSEYLAEDFFIGKALWNRYNGKTISLSLSLSLSLSVCVCVFVLMSGCVNRI